MLNLFTRACCAVDEQYTSQKCAECFNWVVQVKGTTLQICSGDCGMSVARDVNSARNILNVFLSYQGLLPARTGGTSCGAGTGVDTAAPLTTGKHARPHYLTEDKGKHRPQFAEPLRGRQRKDDGKGAEEAEVKGGECVSGGNSRASGTEPTGTAGRLWPTRRCATITTSQTIIACIPFAEAEGGKKRQRVASDSP